MPRYCAVRECRNRGGTTSNVKQETKRSFYPFPLQDKARLQKWVDNMKRGEWTPSRHQYLCSEHFTEDCFDVRWGIRYLKNTAVPTIFPSVQDEGAEKKVLVSKRNTKPKAPPCQTDTELVGPHNSPPDKKPLSLRTASSCTTTTTTTTINPVSENSATADHTQPSPLILPLASETGLASHNDDTSLGETLLSEETRASYCDELPGDSGAITASRPAPPSQAEERWPRGGASDSTVTVVLCHQALCPFSDGGVEEDSTVTVLCHEALCPFLDGGVEEDSTVTVLCREALGPFSDGGVVEDSTVTVLCPREALGPFSDGGVVEDSAALRAALGHNFISLVPVELVEGETLVVDCVLGGGDGGEEEHVSAYEHSYCRPDLDRERLWGKILSLHAKILELDRREEGTVARIHALESEVVHMRRDSAVFKEKQQVFEDYITSILL